MRLLLAKRGGEVSLLPAIKRGGEGSVHPILGVPGLVAKVFTEPSGERAEKLGAMIENPPAVTANAPVLLAWPEDRLLNQRGECVGYVMPYAKDKETFFAVSHPATRPPWADFGLRLRAAKNIAAAVSAFHRHGYVIGDINESNALVGPDGSVAWVDTDSAQVSAGRRMFRCQVGKPDYTPPELHQAGLSFAQIDRHPHHDAFGLAVLIFTLLMDGNHPFAARYVGNTGRQTLADRIAQGHWPHSKSRINSYQPRRDAPPLESLHPELQRLLRECFEAGHKNPTCRPTADEWCKALTEAEAEWDTPKAKLRHYYHRLRPNVVCGQAALHAAERLWPAVTRVPREVWAAAGGVIATLLICLCFGVFNRSEPASGSGGPPTRGGASPRVQGEETPRLWRDVQDPKLRWRGTADSGTTAPTGSRGPGEESPRVWRDARDPEPR